MKKLFFQFLFIINLLIWELFSDEFVCRDGISNNQVYYRSIKRNVNEFISYQNNKWEPIRIHIEYTQLNTFSHSFPSDLISKIVDVMNTVKIILESLISVKRESQPLVIKDCWGRNLTELLSTQGVESDFIISPGIDFALPNYISAISYSCGWEIENHRQVSGAIDFNPHHIKFSEYDAADYLTISALREIFQMFAFNEDYLGKFINEDGTKIPIDKIIKYTNVRGKHVKMISTPKAVEKARKHFNCSLLEGVEIEYDQHRFHHGFYWESRIMNGDIMNLNIELSNSISEITLAFLEDTGWYKVNYYTGGLFQFGKNRGCSFITEKCVNNGTSKFKNEFPIIQEGDIMCTANRKGRGIASIFGNNENCYHEAFGNKEVNDFCPFPVKLRKTDYLDSLSCIKGHSKIYSSQIYDTISADSYCFYSSLIAKNNLGDFFNKRAVCHPVKCNYISKSYKVIIDSSTIECGKGNSEEKIDGFTGKIECPEFSNICYQETKCFDIFDCVMKKSIVKETPKCPSQKFYNEELGVCVIASDCPDDTFGDNVTQSCVEAEMCDSSTPFADPNTKMCVDSFSCSNGYYGDKTLKLCVSSDNCSIDYPYVDPSTKLCTYECSEANPYLDPSEKKCVDFFECSLSTPIADPYTFTCVSKCGKGTIQKDSLCVENNGMCPENTYRYKNHCVRMCPKNNFEEDKVRRSCIDCSSFNLFFYGNKCVNLCPEYTAPYPDGSNNCVECKSIGLFWYNNQCVENCPDQYFPDVYNNCEKNWREQLKYLFLGQIVDICPPGYVSSNEIRECYSCFSLNKYWLDGKCVDNCPPDLTVQNHNCIDCKNLGLLTFRKKCINCCPLNSIIIDENTCDCPANLKFSEYLNECVDECSMGMGYLRSLDKCVYCQHYKRFLYNGICLDACPSGSFTDNIQGICEIIKFLNVKNKPLDSCSQDTCLNSGSCSKSLTFFKCICPDNYFGNFCEFRRNELTETTEKFSNYFNGVYTRIFIPEISVMKANMETLYSLVRNFPEEYQDENLWQLSKKLSNILINF